MGFKVFKKIIDTDVKKLNLKKLTNHEKQNITGGITFIGIATALSAIGNVSTAIISFITQMKSWNMSYDRLNTGYMHKQKNAMMFYQSKDYKNRNIILN